MKYRSLGLTLGFICALGCMKASEKKEDLGPEVSADTINAALDKATRAADLRSLAVGQYLLYADTRRIENDGSSINLGARRIEVLDRTNMPDYANFTLLITNSTRQTDGTFTTTQAEETLRLNKSTSEPVLNTASLVHAAASPAPPRRVAFHHFRESDTTLEVPAMVKARANCGNVPNCQLLVHVVQFDMVLWQDDSSYQKITLDFAFSNATPFIPFGANFDQLSGALIVDCRSTYIPLESRSVYVRDCSTLDDFQK